MTRYTWGKADFPRLKCPTKLPIVLSPAQVAAFFKAVPGLKYRAALMICYGAWPDFLNGIIWK